MHFILKKINFFLKILIVIISLISNQLIYKFLLILHFLINFINLGLKKAL